MPKCIYFIFLTDRYDGMGILVKLFVLLHICGVNVLVVCYTNVQVEYFYTPGHIMHMWPDTGHQNVETKHNLYSGI